VLGETNVKCLMLLTIVLVADAAFVGDDRVDAFLRLIIMSGVLCPFLALGPCRDSQCTTFRQGRTGKL